MAMKRCENNHLYDSAKHSDCPYCGIKSVDIGKTEPKKQNEKKAGTTGNGTTMPKKEESGTTVPWIRKEMGIDPVVGWVVCVEGLDKGQDYRIRSGRNFIGRGEKMDICLKGDSISREKHAIISFDPKKTTFILQPGESSELVYLNNEAVYNPQSLKPYDCIELGKTKLVFVPFCGEGFGWGIRAKGEIGN